MVVVGVGFQVETFVESEEVVVQDSLSSVVVVVVGSLTGGLKNYVEGTPMGV